jgi:hypothetical protein
MPVDIIYIFTKLKTKETKQCVIRESYISSKTIYKKQSKDWEQWLTPAILVN